MRARPLGRVRRQCSKRSANSVKAASAGVSIGVDIGSISQIDHEMKVYLRSTTFQMSRTLTGSTQWVRASSRNYPTFTLAMDRSPGFGSTPSDCSPFEDSVSLRLPYTVKLATESKSLTHYTKGTQSPAQRQAPTACTH